MAAKRPKPAKPTIALVREFHEVFGHPIQEAPLTPPVDRIKLRLNLIIEEQVEMIQACGGDKPRNAHLSRAADLMSRAMEQIRMAKDYEFDEVDLVAVADSLGDQDYVVSGAALEFGIPHEKVVAEIHRSNMTKAGPDGKPIYDEHGKVIKGPDYEQPNIAGILQLPEPEESVA